MFRKINDKLIKGFLINISNNTAEIWFPYSIETMKIIREGRFLAVKNFRGVGENKATQQPETYYSILEVTSKKAIHWQIEDIKINPRGVLISDEFGKFKEAWNRQIDQSENPDIKIIVYASISGNDIYIPSDLSSQVEGIKDPYIIKEARHEPILGEDVYVIDDEVADDFINKNMDDQPHINAGKHKIYDIDIKVNYEELIRRHFGIFGFTGSGKSNLASTLVNKIMHKTREDADVNILIFDVNNEYFGLLFDVLLKADCYLIFLDPGAMGITLLAYLAGRYDLLDEAAQELVLSTNFSAAVRNAAPKENLVNLAKRLLFFKQVKIFVNLESINIFVANVIAALQTEINGATSQRVKQYLSLISATIESLIIIRSELNIEPADIAIILEVLDLFKERNIQGIKDFFTKHQLLLELDEELFSDKVIANNLSRIDNIRNNVVNEVKKRLDYALMYQTIGFDGLTNILHDSKGSLLIFIAENENKLRDFATDLGQMVYRIRKNKQNRKGGKIVEPPILFFFEEADMFIPLEPTGTKEEKDSIKNSIDLAKTIARRGRKYNMGLGIATQRSRYLNTSIMGQIGTYFIGKLPRKADRDVITDGFGVDDEILNQTLNFIPGDWLAISHVDALGVTATPLPMHFDNAEQRLAAFITEKVVPPPQPPQLPIGSGVFRTDISDTEVVDYSPVFLCSDEDTTNKNATDPLSSYKLSPEKKERFQKDYVLINEGIVPSSKSKAEIIRVLTDKTKENNRNGIYFWLLESNNERYCIYIGRTNDLKRRIEEYCNDFQPHSPNDFKIQFMYDYMVTLFGDKVKLSLYFRSCGKDDNARLETEEISYYKPFINEQLPLDEKLKGILFEAYKEYYRVIFDEKIKGTTETQEKDPPPPPPPSGYKAYLESLISTGSCTQKELVEMVHGSYPDVKETTINTMITDSRNPKYNKLSKLTTKTADGKIKFT